MSCVRWRIADAEDSDVLEPSKVPVSKPSLQVEKGEQSQFTSHCEDWKVGTYCSIGVYLLG